MGDIKQKLPKRPFTCEMCKTFSIGKHSYIYKTFEVLPKTPSENLRICEKCANREVVGKNKKTLEELFD